MKFFSFSVFANALDLRVVVIVFTLLGALIGTSGISHSEIQGVCSSCHTMHNSQNGEPMNLDNSTTPNSALTRSTCYGCHAQGGASSTVNLGPSVVPQVMHSAASHLAGGNFGYITGMAGSGASDSKGHNISDLTGVDSVFSDTFRGRTPGGIKVNGHDNGFWVSAKTLRCAGNNGCHGYRAYGGGGVGVYYGTGIKGSHHRNEGGQLDQATNPANSYRFLMAVKGYESSDWEKNPSIMNHNEYYGQSTPIQLGCSALSCHKGPGGLVQPPNGTMSQFCATCHGNFHTLANGESDGIGSTASSPFKRHPTDLSLPSNGEYAAYTVYNLNAPVAWTTVPGVSSSVVTPGTDVVMCLSCHVAHASNYSDMLRWDYSTMIAGNAGAAAGKGCFTCHSTKE